MKKVKCSCGVEFYNNRWQDHYKTHPECRIKNEEIKKQKEIEESPFVCEFCGSRFKKQQYLTRHQINDCKCIPENKKPLSIREQETLDREKDGIQCAICGKYCFELGYHLTQFHNISIDEYCSEYNFKKEDLHSDRSKKKRIKANTANWAKGSLIIKEKLKNKEYKNFLGKRISYSQKSNQELIEKRRLCLSELNKRDDFKERSSNTLKKTWLNNRELMLENLKLNRDKILETYGEDFFSSKVEVELANWIKSLDVQIDENNRTIIDPLELDIYIPSHNLAIEFDGLFWHCDKFKKSNHHLLKTKLCESKGVRLIHIFEDEWKYNRDIVESRLKNILGFNSQRIGARKTIIKEIDTKEKNEFLEKYHIQGSDKSSVKLGAYYQDKLIGVMTFGLPRLSMGQKYSEKNKYELIRFATISDTYTPGLASKMFRYFIKNYDPKEVYSYADRRWSQGKLYESIGFTFVHFSDPNYWYVKGTQREHRFKYRKQELKNLFPEIYSDDKTEFEIMDEAGYLRIYDCGNYKYSWRKENKQ